jgi:large subunit ribosomal protein L22
MSEAVARAKFVRGSYRKYGQVLDMIRGRKVEEALGMLKFLNKPTKEPIVKILKSAIANAESKLGKAKFAIADYRITDARADTGPIMKRMRAAPRGRGVLIRKRFAHLTIKISDEKGL